MKFNDIEHLSEINYAWIIPPVFNVELANKLCVKLTGFHNFASFFRHPNNKLRSGEENKNTYRRINLCRVIPGEPYENVIANKGLAHYNFEIVCVVWFLTGASSKDHGISGFYIMWKKQH